MAVIKNALFVVVGFVLGSVVNMALLAGGSALIPAPQGVDVNDAESIANSIHLFEAKHFVFPFLAHAVGTLFGALVAGYLGWKNRVVLVWCVAVLFFAGGVATTFMIPAPVTYIAVDLTLAFAPMAVLALWALNNLLSKSRGSG
ncbi:MAG: hypothetical protein H6978_04410 [Gammaproteobacteria bacterium]|nr:hypothetical protein [Gammaproteobacteria bacterium]